MPMMKIGSSRLPDSSVIGPMRQPARDQHGREADREQVDRERPDDVEQAREDTVDDAAEEAGDDADDRRRGRR